MTEEINRPWVSRNGNTLLKGQAKDVFEAALDRTRDLYRLFEHVVVSFSGGKDSTCVLEVARIVAREQNRLPVHVITCDEEVIDPDSVDYIEERRRDPEIDLMLLAVPLRHTLAGQLRSHWYCWDPDERAVWARPLPEGAVTNVPGFIKGDHSYTEACGLYLRQRWPEGSLVASLGIRVAESFNRRRALIQSGFMTQKRFDDLSWWIAKPIFDWEDRDVWRAIMLNGWPHSRYYDRCWLNGISLKNQRVAPWGNVASRSFTGMLPAFYPDFWPHAIRRLPELRAMQRYGHTALYRSAIKKPSGLTWREYAFILINRIDEEEAKVFWMHYIASLLKRVEKHTTRYMPDATDGTDTMSWQHVCGAVAKNDLITAGNGHLASRDRL